MAVASFKYLSKFNSLEMCLLQRARPFRYCRPHYVHFHELRLPISSRYFCLFYIASVLLPHTKASLLLHICLAVFLLSMLIQSRQKVYINARPP